MKTEILKIRHKETALKIMNTQVDAVRIKDLVKKGVRVYEDQKIGISGAIGDIPDEQLIEKAVANLATQIEYPYDIESNKAVQRDFSQQAMAPKQLLNHAEAILTILREEYSDFDFSEKIAAIETEYHLTNSEGLDLKYSDAFVELGLVLKEKSSANLFDGFLGYHGRTFDQDQFLAFNRTVLNAYRTPVALPEGNTMPVFFLEFNELQRILALSLNGERYATGSSLFSGKLDQQLFNEKVQLSQNFDSEMLFRPFFDHEGVCLKDNQYPLIENGILKGVFTDKKIAATYGLPHTGAASGEYDGMPTLNYTSLRFGVDSKNIKTALKGQLALLIVVAAGGDFTPDGSYASPVQVGFLFDGERLLGKLPEFQIRSHLNKLLGDHYIGTFESPFYMGDFGQLQGFEMDIVR